MEKQVTRLAAKLKFEKKKRVAAYARVSTGKDTMLHSLAQQISYYSDLIQKKPEWIFAGVFADEASTGTKATRPEFQRLLAECRNGNVNIVLTKSISRFARNTLTLLETVRELRALGVDVYFEEQRIHTMSADGELMLTILASYAQEESKSVSDNQKWRIRKGYANGELMCWRFLYGYKISKDGGVEIDPVQGKVAQEIFQKVADGQSLSSVARWLNRSGYFGIFGGRWKTPHLRRMLTNEKYLGNALLQKTFINNHLEKQQLPNQGELPKYYVADSHPALIDSRTFNRVQEHLAAIADKHSGVSNRKTSEFTGMIRCPYCGRNFRRIITNGSPGWICPTYYTEGKEYCRSKKIPEGTIKSVIMQFLSLDEWSATAFSRQVQWMVASGPNTLELHMTDGCVRYLEWQDRSRRNSWTPEMKEKARQAALRRHHG